MPKIPRTIKKMEVLKMEAQVNYTELLEREYGQDEMAMKLVRTWRSDGDTDEENQVIVS